MLSTLWHDRPRLRTFGNPAWFVVACAYQVRMAVYPFPVMPSIPSPAQHPAIDCSSVYPVNRHYDMRLLSWRTMTTRLPRKYRRMQARVDALGLGRCKHTTCDRAVPPWNKHTAGRLPSWEELAYCSIRCAIRHERRRRRLMREHVAQAAAAQLRYCHVCDTRIPADRLRRHHNARSCSDACSIELRVQTKRQASKRHKRRLSRRRAQDRADAMVDTALCSACSRPIPAERRVQWPHVVTCSSDCTKQHQKELVKLAKRRQRERQKENHDQT